MGERDHDRQNVRLHVVTGKGGTGKTTTAVSLALALASEGRSVLVVEVEERQGIAQLLGLSPLPYEERRIAASPHGGEVYALAVDAEAALLEYLELFYGMRRAGAALSRMGVVDFATTIAPGMRDVLLTGKATEALRRTRGSGRDRKGGDPGQDPFAYHAVVLDAPPTGRINRFLNASAEVAGLARNGPIRNHADTVTATLRSPATAVHVATTLEEMPAREALDGIGALESVGLNAGSLITTMVRPPLFDPDTLRTAETDGLDHDILSRGLEAAGLDDTQRLADELARETARHARHTRVADGIRRQLRESGRTRYELPLVEGGIDRAALDHLADELRNQGAV
ncbi:arsenite efflux ATP-binding protein ArsA [Haloactinospora alba]|uniref:Arsenite efflux ATP-binding protein ArsA n=1 Tax=Haloactinospora alba TaxID=405555 RepID=A0A543NA45_9ACTN|nr:ArsA-related P-loop ATPase [Haloactinospora alba]TQN28690.1 arsenite efflux ATP-binding protein ArsA [Haloactinospora alba]